MPTGHEWFYRLPASGRETGGGEEKKERKKVHIVDIQDYINNDFSSKSYEGNTWIDKIKTIPGGNLITQLIWYQFLLVVFTPYPNTTHITIVLNEDGLDLKIEFGVIEVPKRDRYTKSYHFGKNWQKEVQEEIERIEPEAEKIEKEWVRIGEFGEY